MSLPTQAAARCCKHLSGSVAVRPSSSLRIATCTQSRLLPTAARTPGYRRWESTDAPAAAVAAPATPKVKQIVDLIGELKLEEVADLVASMKSRFNIPDNIPMGGFAMAPGAAGGAAAAAPAEEEEAAPAAAAKTLFDVKLESFEAGSKPKIIKEVKTLLGLSLVDSKKFVESVPKVMKESVPKEDAEKMIETLKGLGAKASME